MLTDAQENIIFTSIGTAYIVKGHAYTAVKTWRDHWSGEINTPIIVLHFKSQTHKKQEAIGRRAEWDFDPLSVDVFAITDVTNGVHGSDIAKSIMRELELWFKESATALICSEGMSVGYTTPVQNLSFLEEGVYRRTFDANILYKLI